MANKRLEPKHVIVPLDPIDRVSSIARPESRKSVLIHLGVDLECVLETGEEVLDRSTAPVCLDAVGEGLAERGGAGWVDGDDEVALLGEDLRGKKKGEGERMRWEGGWRVGHEVVERREGQTNRLGSIERTTSLPRRLAGHRG